MIFKDITQGLVLASFSAFLTRTIILLVTHKPVDIWLTVFGLSLVLSCGLACLAVLLE